MTIGARETFSEHRRGTEHGLSCHHVRNAQTPSGTAEATFEADEYRGTLPGNTSGGPFQSAAF